MITKGEIEDMRNIVCETQFLDNILRDDDDAGLLLTIAAKQQKKEFTPAGVVSRQSASGVSTFEQEDERASPRTRKKHVMKARIAAEKVEIRRKKAEKEEAAARAAAKARTEGISVKRGKLARLRRVLPSRKGKRCVAIGGGIDGVATEAAPQEEAPQASIWTEEELTNM